MLIFRGVVENKVQEGPCFLFKVFVDCYGFLIYPKNYRLSLWWIGIWHDTVVGLLESVLDKHV